MKPRIGYPEGDSGPDEFDPRFFLGCRYQYFCSCGGSFGSTRSPSRVQIGEPSPEWLHGPGSPCRITGWRDCLTGEEKKPLDGRVGGE